jgi:hypothetical protein
LIALFIVIMAGSIGHVGAHAQSGQVDWSPVEHAMGVKGEVAPDGAIKFGIPRNISVTLDGIKLAPGSDLMFEADFMKAGNETLMVGELVLKEDEADAVTKELIAAGINETALHNHLLRESPPIVYLHFHGHGGGVYLASMIHDIIEAHGGEMTASPGGPLTGIDEPGLDRIMGQKGSAGWGVYAFSIPRKDRVYEMRTELSPAMDISSQISFQPIKPGESALVGELVLKANEVEPVIKALTKNNIEVTAVHSHMLTEEPRLFYLHCWAVGNTTGLAKGIREALDRTNSEFLTI